MPLVARSVADFYAELMARLRELRVECENDSYAVPTFVIRTEYGEPFCEWQRLAA